MEQWMQRFNRPIPVVVALGILSAVYFGVLGTVWAVTGEFTRWGGHLLKLAGYPIEQLSYFNIVKMNGLPWQRVDGWVVFGMFFGALIAALSSGNWKLRVPIQKRRIVQGLIGGVIAGFGTRMAMGCNLAALFTGIPQFTLHAMLFTIGTIAGTWLGLKVALSAWFLGVPKILANKGRIVQTVSESKKSRQPWFALVVSIVFALIVGNYFVQGLNALALAALFGLGFGWLIEKGQVCFTSAFRDLWISGRSTIAKALVLGMAVQVLGTAWFIAHGAPAKIMWAGPGALLGGLLFGIGIVIAGGCETGWMYRAMEGQVHFWFVGIGNVIGATILTLLWDKGIYQTLVAPWPKVDFVKLYGWPAALLIVYGFLILLYAFVKYVEKKKSFASMVKLPLSENIFVKRGENVARG